MRRFWFLLFLSLPISLLAQKIQYVFAAPNAQHHEAEIAVTVSGVKPGPLFFRMSRSSPGRYATHEFGKNVYNVSAVDGTGKNIAVEKADADVYKVAQQGTVTMKYTLYGNYADGTYASIDATGYHLNMPATFMWVKGLDNAPITVKFIVPDTNWTIATQLQPSADPHTFSAPGLQYFMDAPTKIADLHMREWNVSNLDHKSYKFRLALEANAPDNVIDSFTKQLQKIVKEAQAVFGEVPAYDYGTYTFIASLNPYVHGDGMEHRNSTMIASRREFTGDNSFLNTFAHEFFHCWNVERIRPKSLEPFNFEKSNMSEALWVAEGFTQYYGLLLMKRAGLMNDSDFFTQMTYLINAKENTPGGNDYTPIENSQRAVFVDAGVAIDQTNYPNMFTSYYAYGGALALALDLQLRKQFSKSLDGFMQQMWKTFGKPEKAYTLPEMQHVLAAYTTPDYATAFFKKQVYGHEPINYNALLQAAGLKLEKPVAGNAWIGNIRFATDATPLIIADNTVRNTPLYKAGVDIDDVLLELDGQRLQQSKDLATVLSQHQPGDQIKLVYKHHNKLMETNLVLEENPFMRIAPLEAPDATDTNTQQFRNNWLGSKAINNF